MMEVYGLYYSCNQQFEVQHTAVWARQEMIITRAQAIGRGHAS